MRVAQIVLPSATAYERKSQRVDAAALANAHQVQLTAIEALDAFQPDIAHVYAAGRLAASAFRGINVPFVSAAAPLPSRWSLRPAPRPAVVVSPLAAKDSPAHLPEAVEDAWFEAGGGGPRRDRPAIGSFFRPAVRNAVEQAAARIERFRPEVEWRLFEREPEPSEVAGLDLWVDPAVDEDDFDGFVAEALAAGIGVVATRTPLNSLRLEKGRTGMLVPPSDPNEMTHAILAALFKPEILNQKRVAAGQTITRFRPRQRLRALTRLYETLLS